MAKRKSQEWRDKISASKKGKIPYIASFLSNKMDSLDAGIYAGRVINSLNKGYINESDLELIFDRDDSIDLKKFSERVLNVELGESRGDNVFELNKIEQVLV